MNDKVKELVEWVHNRLPLYDCPSCEHARLGDSLELLRCTYPSAGEGICIKAIERAKQILSHPDLALIDREKIVENLKDYPMEGIVPLAEALKESNEHQRD